MAAGDLIDVVIEIGMHCTVSMTSKNIWMEMGYVAIEPAVPEAQQRHCKLTD